MMRASIFAAALLTLAGCAQNQAAPPVVAAASLSTVRGAFFALSVADAARTADWYSRLLGFRVLSQGTAPERGIAFALLEREGSLIEIVQRPDARAPAFGADGKRNAVTMHGAFKVGLVVSDLVAMHDRLAANGTSFEHHIVQPKDNPLRTFAVRDPEGNIVQIFG